MAVQIAVAGKGGTGKTSFCALLIRYLLDKGKAPVLAIDADANANLNEVLGLPIESETVSELIAATKEPDKIPGGMTQDVYIKYKLSAALSEGNKVDLLVMGGPEGPGCFCFPNNILRSCMDQLTKGYPYVSSSSILNTPTTAALSAGSSKSAFPSLSYAASTGSSGIRPARASPVLSISARRASASSGVARFKTR